MPLRKLFQLLALLTGVLLALPALGQAAPSGQTHIAATLSAERAIVPPGATVLLAIAMKPEAGWHGYWKNGGDAGFGMTLKWSLPAGAAVGELRYPVPETLLINGLMNHVYEHDYALFVPLTLPRGARVGDTLPITAKADWLACTEEICVPEHARIATTVRIGAASPRDPRFDAWQAKLPAPLPEAAHFAVSGKTIRLAVPIPASLALEAPHFFAATDNFVAYAKLQSFARKGDLLLIDLEQGESAAPVPPPALDGVLRYGNGEGLEIHATPGAVPSGGTPLAGAREGQPSLLALLAVLGGALLGGLVLNVMPCVFPILSLKALSLAQANSDPTKARRDALGYTAGVVLACLGLGGVMLGLRAAGTEVGWAFQLQEPLVVAALLLLAVAITANLAGLFELPTLAASSGRSSFATGLLAAFVATPCTGPFMAAAMGAALVLPPPLALAVFAALGLGLALPFLALGFAPALRRVLPRPGPWMATFRKAMAVPMALTALALLWLAWRIGSTTFAVACAGLALALVALLVLTGKRQRSGRAASALAAAGIAAMIFVGAVLLPRIEAAPASEAGGVLGARPFSEAALAQARASGKPVFVYFTADWCLTCKVNESAAIEREGTRNAFAEGGVAVLRGDWTRRDAAITRFLEVHGAAGVPLYLWYAPRAEAKTLPQVLTRSLLADCASGRACG